MIKKCEWCDTPGPAIICRRCLGFDVAPVAIAPPVVVVVAPTPPPIVEPRAKRLCLWPGCGRIHARRGFCQRCARRVLKMDAEGVGPEELPALWQEYLTSLGAVFAANGAAGNRWRHVG